MPLHSLTPLSDHSVLGLWQLREPAQALLQVLPERYAAIQPTGRDQTRSTQWLAGRVLAHEVLREFCTTSVILVNDANGRPFFEQLPAFAVSLSHSGQWVSCMIATRGHVGTDVELVRDKAQKLAPRFLSEAERADAGDETAKHSLYWSAKETIYKLYSRRGLVFKEHILLDPFKLREAGVLTGHLLLENSRSKHQIHYQRLTPDYVLTYAYCEMVMW
ncbi:4'-phosphopantetheinyl transferase superfamily protein [uncultured Hymenobacter sp.]|uniref:4'-phosphopantetheinyl transferase superfamily protein n=1 Tax=uncultured Hymenobacter sp. TaxID=170016 RepID=UPI0035CC6D61